MARRQSIADRFWPHVLIPPDPDECWLWEGNHDRYGVFWLNNSTTPAHRIAYQLFRGSIPPGLQIDHLCRTTLCVNPFHLEAVSPWVNTMRGVTPAAANARKTHCPRGHQFDAANTYIWNRHRHCRSCKQIEKRRRRAKERELHADHQIQAR